jgi:hypothetical protein
MFAPDIDRVVLLGGDGPAIESLRSDAGPVQWRAVAKDGADLPPSQATRLMVEWFGTPSPSPDCPAGIRPGR